MKVVIDDWRYFIIYLRLGLWRYFILLILTIGTKTSRICNMISTTNNNTTHTGIWNRRFSLTHFGAIGIRISCIRIVANIQSSFENIFLEEPTLSTIPTFASIPAISSKIRIRVKNWSSYIYILTTMEHEERSIIQLPYKINEFILASLPLIFSLYYYSYNKKCFLNNERFDNNKKKS